MAVNISVRQALTRPNPQQNGIVGRLHKIYASLRAKASDCIECDVCLERCPFGVDVIGKMHGAVKVFESAA